MTEVAKKVARGRRERLEDVRRRVTRDQFKQTRQPPPRALAILAEHAVRQIVYEKDVAERAAAKQAKDEEERIKEESERAVAAEDEVTKLPLAWTPVVQSLFGEMKIKINATGGYMLEVKSARDLGIARGTPLPVKVADSALQPNETKKADHILILTQRDQYSLRVTTLYVGTEDKCRAAARDANATYLINSMMERILQFGSAHVSLKTSDLDIFYRSLQDARVQFVQNTPQASHVEMPYMLARYEANATYTAAVNSVLDRIKTMTPEAVEALCDNYFASPEAHRYTVDRCVTVSE
jgi:hypothetical protein